MTGLADAGHAAMTLGSLQCIANHVQLCDSLMLKAALVGVCASDSCYPCFDSILNVWH